MAVAGSVLALAGAAIGQDGEPGGFFKPQSDVEEWAQTLRDGSFFGKSRTGSGSGASSRRSAKASRTEEPRRQRAASARRRDEFGYSPVTYGGKHGDGTSYRTVCVRLCDGYYWPISFGATRSRFERDSQTCEQSCSAPAALFYHDSSSEDGPAEMVNLAGEPYTLLGTAFLYRTKYNPNCKCRPHPWEVQEAEERRRASAPEVATGPAPDTSQAQPAAPATPPQPGTSPAADGAKKETPNG